QRTCRLPRRFEYAHRHLRHLSGARAKVTLAALDLARSNLKTSRATFERVVGHPPSHLVEARATNLVPKSVQENVDISIRESPSVVAALYREQAARFNIDLIRG